MSKRVQITATEIGGAVTTLSIFHTEVTASNLIVSGVLPSELLGGYNVEMPDTATLLIAECESGECFEKTGSVSFTPYVQQTRWFTVNSDGNGTVSVISPVSAGPTTTFISQSVNFSNFSSFVISAASTYPIQFDGWYDAPTGGSLVSAVTPLTVTLNTYTSTDDFYARFS